MCQGKERAGFKAPFFEGQKSFGATVKIISFYMKMKLSLPLFFPLLQNLIVPTITAKFMVSVTLLDKNWFRVISFMDAEADTENCSFIPLQLSEFFLHFAPGRFLYLQGLNYVSCFLVRSK